MELLKGNLMARSSVDLSGYLTAGKLVPPKVYRLVVKWVVR